MNRLKDLPPVRWLRRRRHARRFFSDSTAVATFGVYGSFAEARAAIPPGRVVGWDHPEPASMYHTETSVNPRDYPVLFWLSSVWCDVGRVFDFGGHIGHKRYAFEPYLPFSDAVEWTVCDVPAVVEEGRKIALERCATGLSFTTSFQDVVDSDVLLCLGVLQYIEEPLASLLGSLARRPKHIIVNGCPIHPDTAFTTLVRNAGKGFSPYRIANRREFVDAMLAVGYDVVDQWRNPGKSCWIPLHEDLAVRDYSGFYFRRQSSTESKND